MAEPPPAHLPKGRGITLLAASVPARPDMAFLRSRLGGAITSEALKNWVGCGLGEHLGFVAVAVDAGDLGEAFASDQFVVDGRVVAHDAGVERFADCFGLHGCGDLVYVLHVVAYVVPRGQQRAEAGFVERVRLRHRGQRVGGVIGIGNDHRRDRSSWLL